MTPDAPAPVWESEAEPVFAPGGAANVAHQFRHLPAVVTFATVHDDSRDLTMSGAGSIAQANLRAPECRLRILSRAGGVATKTRLVSGGHVLARLDDNREVFRKRGPEVRRRLVTELIDEVDAVVGQASGARVAVLSDYAQGFWTADTAAAAVKMCQVRRMPCIVDPKPRGVPLEAWKGCTVLKLNAAEARAFVPGTPAGSEEFAARRLHVAMGCDVVMTRGERPPWVVTAHGLGDVFGLPLAPLPGRDLGRPLWASGAGDCFAAYLAAGLAHGNATSHAAAVAHAAGAAYILKSHNQAVHPREAAEVADWPGARVYAGTSGGMELADRLRALPAGSRVGYTNGVFDLFHAGHASTLAYARNLCDYLVVAVNSSASATRVKGRPPIMDTAERLAAVAACRHVSAAIAFDEDTPTPLYRVLGTADVLVKGVEYAGLPVEGAEFARRVCYAASAVTVHSSDIRDRVAAQSRPIPSPAEDSK